MTHIFHAVTHIMHAMTHVLHVMTHDDPRLSETRRGLDEPGDLFWIYLGSVWDHFIGSRVWISGYVPESALVGKYISTQTGAYIPVKTEINSRYQNQQHPALHHQTFLPERAIPPAIRPGSP